MLFFSMKILSNETQCFSKMGMGIQIAS